MGNPMVKDTDVRVSAGYLEAVKTGHGWGGIRFTWTSQGGLAATWEVGGGGSPTLPPSANPCKPGVRAEQGGSVARGDHSGLS